jgi:hypothetical protein
MLRELNRQASNQASILPATSQTADRPVGRAYPIGSLAAISMPKPARPT